MIVRRLLCGVLLTGLAAPLLAAAPHAREPRALRETIPAPPPGTNARVFARADAADPEPSPAASAVPSASAMPSASTAPGATGAPAADTLPASQPSAEIATRARAEFEANRSGKIDRSHYTSDMNAHISDAALVDVSTALKSLGPVKSFNQVRKITQGSLAVYVFRIEFAKPPAIEEAIGWNAAGKIDFLQFGPAR